MKEKLMNGVTRFKAVAIPALATGIVAVPTLCPFAAEDASTTTVDLASITTSAMESVKGDMVIVIAAAVAVSVSLIGMTVGIAYLQKKLKGLKSVA